MTYLTSEMSAMHLPVFSVLVTIHHSLQVTPRRESLVTHGSSTAASKAKQAFDGLEIGPQLKDGCGGGKGDSEFSGRMLEQWHVGCPKPNDIVPANPVPASLSPRKSS